MIIVEANGGLVFLFTITFYKYSDFIAISIDWDIENIAIFMKECGDTMCCEVLGNKAINGRVPELSYILYYLWQVGDFTFI